MKPFRAALTFTENRPPFWRVYGPREAELFNGKPLADCQDEQTAKLIAAALNMTREAARVLPTLTGSNLEAFTKTFAALAQHAIDRARMADACARINALPPAPARSALCEMCGDGPHPGQTCGQFAGNQDASRQDREIEQQERICEQ